MCKQLLLSFRELSRPKLALLIAFLGIALLFSLILYIDKERADGLQADSLLSINGIPIPEEEFKLFLQDEKAATASYFARTYNAEYSSEFWETVYGEEIPIDIARTNALKKLIRIKVEQDVAVNYRVIKSVQFADLQQAILKEKSSIYGADGLNLFQEYMLFHSKLLLDTKNRFKASSPAVSDTILRDHYEAQKQQLFQLPDELIVWRISWISEEAEEEQRLVEKLTEDIRKGMSVGQSLSKYKRLQSLQIAEKHYGSMESRDENSSELGAMLKEQAYLLSKDQVSEILQYGKQSFVLICSDRIEGELKKFEEVSLLLEDVMLEEKFEQIIEQAASEAIVIFNEEKWNRLQIE